MTVCKVILFGLKPCDINTSTKEIEDINVTVPKHNSSSTNKDSAKNKNDDDFLHIDIKPLLTPTSSVGCRIVQTVNSMIEQMLF
jgi:hypothetical protein